MTAPSRGREASPDKLKCIDGSVILLVLYTVQYTSMTTRAALTCNTKGIRNAVKHRRYPTKVLAQKAFVAAAITHFPRLQAAYERSFRF